MRPAFSLGFVVLALSLLGGAAPALAQPAQGVQPLDRLLPEIRRTHPGQIYGADGPSPGPDGSLHYHLKWMSPDGRIEWLDTDARTGRVLGSSPGRDTFDPPRPPTPPAGRDRFLGSDNGDGGSDPIPRGFDQRGDYGNGPYGNRNDRGGDNGANRDLRQR